jgi:hypothetical protein
MIALAFAAAVGIMPVQTSSPTWLKCDWTETSNSLTAGKLGPDKVSEQSRTYVFDPNRNKLSVYNPEARTLDEVSGVIVTDEVVDVETDHSLTAPNGVHSEISRGFRIDRRTLKFGVLDTILPLPYAPSTSVFTSGDGQCVKIAPQPVTPTQF